MFESSDENEQQPIGKRFLHALSRLLPAASDTKTPKELKLAIALSGGSDSLALAHLARKNISSQHPLTALTVDHRLRPESAKESATVNRWMTERGIAHDTLNWQHEELTGNLQAEARKARYQLLTDWCKTNDVSILLLGHTLDDQAETIALMRERGASSVGLAGMSAKRAVNEITCIRPLLGHSRQELQDWLRSQNIEWLSDPSNNNTDFSRIRIRQHLAKNPAEKTELLELGKKMAQERIAIERLHAAFVDTAVSIQHKSDSLRVSLKEFLALERSQAAYTLGQLLCFVGGKDYPARYAKRQHAVEQIHHSFAQDNPSPFTLGLCQLKVTNEKLLITPEKDSRLFGIKPLVPSPFETIFPL